MKCVTFNERSKSDVLHIELPGCIVNVRLVHDEQGRPVTSISISADGNRYAGEPAWYTATEDFDQVDSHSMRNGLTVRVIRERAT